MSSTRPSLAELGNHPASTVGGSRLLAFGERRPDGDWSADQLGAPFGKSGEWIEARTGIRAVRRLREGQSTTSLGVEAANHAICRAGVSANNIDLVIVASCSVTELDALRIAAVISPDAAYLLLNAACAGFCYALAHADSLIRVGRARTVVIVAVEQMSRMLDPEDLGTSILFGDAAGAAVVSAAAERDAGVGPVVWGSDGNGAGLIASARDGSGYLRMAGQQVFRWAVETVPTLAHRACRAAGVSPEQIDVFVPHQANLRIIDAVVRKLGIDRAVVADDVVGSGNTSAASVPLALTRLIDQGRARSGELALLLGFGAGLSYAGQVVVIP